MNNDFFPIFQYSNFKIYEMRLSMIRQRNARVTHFAKDYVNNINVTISIQ